MDFSENGIHKYLNEVERHLGFNSVPNTNTITYLKGMLTLATHLCEKQKKIPLLLKKPCRTED